MASCCCWVLYRWWPGRLLLYRYLLGMVGINNNIRNNHLLHWRLQVPHHWGLTFYPTEAPKYYTTTYVAPAYTTKAAEYYTTKAAEYYTTKAAEYYTTKAAEYYTKAPVYFTTTHAAPEYCTDVPKNYTTKGIPSITSLLSLLPHPFFAPSYYTTNAAE
jgi:hypothetical protein